MDAIFLFSYASGLYISGLIGDVLDAAKTHAFGLCSAGLIYLLFASLIPYFHVDSIYLFCFLWIINGFVQSAGWPTAVKIVASWFNTGHDGALFGVWASNQCIGNIIGAAYVSLAHTHDFAIQWMFYLPAFQALVVATLVVFCVRSVPPSFVHISHHHELTNVDVTESNTNSNGVELVEIHNKPNQAQNDKINEQLLANRESDGNSTAHSREHEPQPLPPTQRLTFLQIMKLKNVIRYSMCYACLKAVNYTMFFWLPYFESSHFTEADADYLEIYYNIGQVFGGLLCGYISDRFPSRTPTVLVFLICATIPIFLLHIDSLSFNLVMFLTFSAGFLVGGPATILSTVMSAEIAKDPALSENHSVLSTVTGIIDGSGSFGAAVTQYIVAVLSDISMEVIFVLLAVQLALSAVLIAPLPVCNRKTTAQQDVNNLAEAESQ